MKLIRRLLNILDHITTSFGAIAMLVIAILMFVGVLTRYFFDTSIQFSSDIMLGLQAWIVYLLVGIAARSDEHIRIGAASEILFRKKAKTIRTALENIVALPLSIYLSWAGWHWVSYRIEEGTVIQYSSTGEYAAWIPILCLPIGFTIAAIFYLERIIKQLSLLIGYFKDKQLSKAIETHTEIQTSDFESKNH